MKLVFEGKGGYKLERESAKDKLVIGQSYQVEKIQVGGVETNIFYACFDDELLELIQCERGVLEALNSHNDSLIKKNLYLEDQWLISKTKLCKIDQMGFWKRLVFLFRGKI